MELGLYAAATLIAFFVKGLCGFANTLVFTSILSFTQANIHISPVELLIGAPGNFLMLWRERRALRTRLWLPLAALIIAGSVPGMLLLKNAEVGWVRLVFGCVTVFVGVQMLYRRYRPSQRPASRAGAAAICLLSGVLCGLFGVGALLGAYMSRAAKDMHEFKANLCAVFAAENVVRLAAYGAGGILTLQALRMAAMLLPLMLLGMALGMAAAKRVSEERAKLIVIAMLIVSGISLVVKSL